MRYYSTYTNRRGNSYGAGVKPGTAVHTRGWGAGVKVYAGETGSGRDAFAVWITAGSHESGKDLYLGEVRDTPDGPVFVPAFPTDDNAPAYIMPDYLADADDPVSNDPGANYQDGPCGDH